ncbi:MAG TPA: hypothetical protein VH186_07590 [Chloroflexia bacterium]|nr:hypothetical protein [Chloroflexia bacterium]
MLKQTINAWQFVIGEPYKWIFQAFFNAFDLSESLPEKLERRLYLKMVMRLYLPFFTVAFLLSVISLPIVFAWNGYDIPSPYPLAKIGIVTALAEALALFCGSFWRTRFGFIMLIVLGIPFCIANALGIALF